MGFVRNRRTAFHIWTLGTCSASIWCLHCRPQFALFKRNVLPSYRHGSLYRLYLPAFHLIDTHRAAMVRPDRCGGAHCFLCSLLFGFLLRLVLLRCGREPCDLRTLLTAEKRKANKNCAPTVLTGTQRWRNSTEAVKVAARSCGPASCKHHSNQRKDPQSVATALELRERKV